MNKVVVIGGGASGMLAAIIASREGADVTLIEKNEKLGKKIYITGKGRCNLTNACDRATLQENVVGNAKFMYSAFDVFDNQATLDFFTANGLSVKVERGNRVFPVSDHASDVTKCLGDLLKKYKVKVLLNTEVTGIITERLPDNHNLEEKLEVTCTKDKYSKKKKADDELSRVVSIKLHNNEIIDADRIIVCTGGISYPSTGSTGFGIKEAERLGLKTIELNPGLVPFNTVETYAEEMQGLALKNVNATIKNNKGKVIYEGFGEMLFTHFGVSGPLMISASSYVTKHIKEGPLKLSIDLKPAVEREQLEKRLMNLFDKNKNKQLKNILNELLPNAMIPVYMQLADINPDREVNSITKQERSTMLDLLKSFPMTLESFRGYNEAIITRGGVSVKEINPKTMEAKRIQGLYFAGEVLDVDALTGGFNLQIAWSTGYVAGMSAAEND